MRDIIPRGLNEKMKELKEKHDGTIEDMTQRIEAIQLEFEETERTMQEKDAQHMEYRRETELKIEDLVENRHIPRRGIYDTVLVVVEKNKRDEGGKAGEHPYYMIRCKKSHVAHQKSILLDRYPDMNVKEQTC